MIVAIALDDEPWLDARGGEAMLVDTIGTA
jgi:hypothetical protein